MRGLELPSQSQSPAVGTHAELAELSDQVEVAWPDLPPPLVLEWTETSLLAVDRSGAPWVIGPAERDPVRDSRGRSVVPRQQRVKLKRIAELGVPFQRLAIAHELDPDGPVKHFLPALREGPRPCTDEVARALVGGVPAHPGTSRAIRALESPIRAATSTAPIRVLSTVLDPIVFGIIAPTAPRHGEPCLWYPLVAWRW
jgi:hypothetical protein